MKINNTPPGDQLRPIDRNKGAGKAAESPKAGPASTPASSTQAELHSTGATSRDIDSARVDEVRDAIRDGRLDIKTEKIAEGLIKSVRSMLEGKA